MKSLHPWITLAALAASLGACRVDTQRAAPESNPVRHEMRLLTVVLADAVKAIGAGDVRGIAPALHEVHKAKGATEAALRSGRYKPPKNADRVPRFIEVDEAFHELLRALVKASKRNDVAAAADALGVVLRGCHGCHSEFRN